MRLPSTPYADAADLIPPIYRGDGEAATLYMLIEASPTHRLLYTREEARRRANAAALDDLAGRGLIATVPASADDPDRPGEPRGLIVTANPAGEARYSAIRAERPPVTLAEVLDYGRAWDALGGWRSLAGRLVIQWRDTVMPSDYSLVDGTPDPARAIDAAILLREPELIESTTWHDRCHCFRVRTASELAAEGYDDPEIAAAYARGDARIVLDELAVRQVTYRPSEPDCDPERGHARHRWIPDSGPRYSGEGSGVVETDVCVRCCISRRADSGAVDPYDGSGGHRSIAYYRAGDGADGETPIATRGEVEV